MSGFLFLQLGIMTGCADTGGNAADTSLFLENEEFSATLRSVAPYGWVGDHYMWRPEENSGDPVCSDAAACEIEILSSSFYEVALADVWTFRCVSQMVEITQNHSTVEVSDAWLGEGICGLAPDGDYDGKNVDTVITDYGSDGTEEVVIRINSDNAVVTNNTFFGNRDGVLLEGTIADDLSWIEYYLGPPETAGDMQTITRTQE